MEFQPDPGEFGEGQRDAMVMDFPAKTAKVTLC